MASLVQDLEDLYRLLSIRKAQRKDQQQQQQSQRHHRQPRRQRQHRHKKNRHQTKKKKHLSKRQQRLKKGPTVIKYHNTDAHRPIIKEQKMKRGSSGWVGGGIYWADTEAETLGKTQNKGRTLQAKVQLGRTLTVNQTTADTNMTYTKLQKMGYDSVKLTGPSTGDEYVVYNSDQVSEIDYAGSTSSRAKSSRAAMSSGLRCLNNHLLEPLRYNGSGSCDACGRTTYYGQDMMHCCRCNWGLCRSCQ